MYVYCLDNPVSEGEDYRIEVLAALKANKDLLRLDKDDVIKDELTEALALIEELEIKKKEDEQKRLEVNKPI